MRAFAIGMFGFAAFVLASCSSPNYGDAGGDVPPAAAMTFDVMATTGDAGPPLCPGSLYVTASQSPGNATCSNAPEVCVASQDPSANTVVCHCYASSGTSGQGSWRCMDPNM